MKIFTTICAKIFIMLITIIISCLYNSSAYAHAFRNDVVYPPIAGGMEENWGKWADSPEFCNEGTYAYAFRLKIESPRPGDGDDTALNAIELACRDCNEFRDRDDFISSSEGLWGNWSEYVKCEEGAFLYSFDIKVEPSRGREPFLKRGISKFIPGGISKDDTAANEVKFRCKTLSEKDRGPLISPIGGPWGEWQGERRCPEGTAICGIRTSIEPNQGKGDDTSLNNVEFFCCKLKCNNQ